MDRGLNSLGKLKKYLEILREIDLQTHALDAQVGSARLSAIDGFKPYINPKKNIDWLLSFYNTFSASKETMEHEEESLQGAFGEARGGDGFSPRDLKMLREKSVLQSVQTVLGLEEVLREYSNIRMVAVELDRIDKFVAKVLDVLGESFFASLRKIPDQDPELQEFAAFLLVRTDKRMFISRYTNVVYSRLGFDEIGTNMKLLLERTSDLTKFFSGIVKLNDHVLGVENSKVTNVGLLKMFVIGLRRVIADNMMIAEKEERIENVPFLIKLNARLRHSATQRVRIIEELFVFKDDLNKIAFNSMSAHFERLDMVTEPSRCGDIESFCLKIIPVLDAFYDHRGQAEVFAAEYGAAFGVKTAKDIFKEFSRRTIERVQYLAESLKGILRSVYIVNNVYALQNYLEGAGDVSAEDMISENLEDILDVWKDEISKREENDITEFLDRNIENQSRYLLPEKIRVVLVGRVSELVENALSKKKYTGEIESLHRSIDRLYFAE